MRDAVIYLLRHGDAEDGDGDDAARRLTAKGERQGLAIVDGGTLIALLRPKDLAAIAAG
jgi:hypothetical protein